MSKRLFIGELSEHSGVPPQTIRYYEELELLDPPERTDANYRVYSSGHLDRLRFIMQAKTFGLALEEIKQLIDMRCSGTAPCGHLEDMVKRHLENLNQRIEQLTTLRDELLRRYETMGNLPRDGKICGIVESQTLNPNSKE